MSTTDIDEAALRGHAHRLLDDCYWDDGSLHSGQVESAIVSELRRHAVEVAELRAEVAQLRSEPDMVAEAEERLAAALADVARLREMLSQAVRERDEFETEAGTEETARLALEADVARLTKEREEARRELAVSRAVVFEEAAGIVRQREFAPDVRFDTNPWDDAAGALLRERNRALTPSIPGGGA